MGFGSLWMALGMFQATGVTPVVDVSVDFQAPASPIQQIAIELSKTSEELRLAGWKQVEPSPNPQQAEALRSIADSKKAADQLVAQPDLQRFRAWEVAYRRYQMTFRFFPQSELLEGYSEKLQSSATLLRSQFGSPSLMTWKKMSDTAFNLSRSAEVLRKRMWKSTRQDDAWAMRNFNLVTYWMLATQKLASDMVYAPENLIFSEIAYGGLLQKWAAFQSALDEGRVAYLNDVYEQRIVANRLFEELKTTYENYRVGSRL